MEQSVERRKVAWIGPGVHVEGKVVSTEDLVIDGRVDGSIVVNAHHLTIGPLGSVAADLVAKNVTVIGKVQGNVRAAERVDVHASASVSGDISAPRLVLADGATFAGRVETALRASK